MSRITRALRNERQVHYGGMARAGRRERRTQIRASNRTCRARGNLLAQFLRGISNGSLYQAFDSFQGKNGASLSLSLSRGGKRYAPISRDRRERRHDVLSISLIRSAVRVIVYAPRGIIIRNKNERENKKSTGVDPARRRAGGSFLLPPLLPRSKITRER